MAHFHTSNNKSRKNNNINTNRCNDFVDDTEIYAKQEEDTVKTTTKEKHKSKRKEVKQEQEENNESLEVENESFEKITWIFAAEESKKKRDVKKRKRALRN